MPASTVDEFLAAVAPEQRRALESLRKQLHAAAPGATELINYGVPMLRLNGRNLVSFSAAKAHCALYVQSPRVMKAHAKELAAYDTAAATVRFTPDKPLPAALVKKLVQARIAEETALAEAKCKSAAARQP